MNVAKKPDSSLGEIVVFSSWGHPELGEYVSALLGQTLSIQAFIFADEISNESKEITLQRIQGTRPLIKFSDLGLAQIPCFFVRSHNSQDCLKILDSLRPKLVVNAGSPDILRDPVLQAAGQGMLGVHPGKLPNYRGCSAVEWSIFHNDPVAATCFFLTEGIDEGPVVLTREMPVEPGDGYETIRRNMVSHGSRILALGVRKALEKGIDPKGLEPFNSSDGKYFPVISPQAMKKVLQILNRREYQCVLPQ